ncbi:hypothetical protein WJX72_007348 [[Myrmecia] bisecta]|uniref:Actin-related protein 2/3 complex subunit 4 n=1 Tax=[Myrmecia] bisecta TaxID=41462 RepID=A0AAW1Q7M6_9CHLO
MTQAYLASVRGGLDKALCLRDLPCQLVERHNKPEIEPQSSKELLLPPVLLSKTENEKCLIESSINSARISIKVKQTDALEVWLTRKFMQFLMQRAESLGILRRVPTEGYDISFLIMASHVQQYRKQALVDFICQFIQDMSADINELKLLVSARGRAVAVEYLRTLC